jgi:glycogen operon protein
MIRSGDEMGQTQGGNNNAFCQDNEISWLGWELTEAQRALYGFACRASTLMKEHPVLRRRTFLQGQRVRATGEKDVTWLSPAGREMTEAEWQATHVKCLGAMLAGGDIGEMDEDGQPIIGQTIVYLLNADEADVPFLLPPSDHVRSWACLIDTADERRQGRTYRTNTRYRVIGRSVAVLRAQTPTSEADSSHAP